MILDYAIAIVFVAVMAVWYYSISISRRVDRIETLFRMDKDDAKIDMEDIARKSDGWRNGVL